MVGPARRFEVRGLLGQGSFGAVYLAHSVGGGIQREVAIKVLHKEQGASPALVSRLRDEARMLALIRHRAIVRVDDLLELDGAWSIVMEYVEGCDLAALIEAGPIPPHAALCIAEEVASALHAAYHQAGPDGQPLRLVHRDVKPSNVRVTPNAEVKLLDFGVARADFAGREAGTTKTAFGTLVYMSPERFEGTSTVAGDVYALGVTLFEMLTGVPPGKLAGDRDRQPPGGRLADKWKAIQDTSPDLARLVAAMLAYDPEERPDARAVARTLRSLRAAISGESLEDWASVAVPRQLAAGHGAPKPDVRTGTLLIGGGSSAQVVTPRPRPWWALAAGAGVVAVVGVLGGVLVLVAWLAAQREEALGAVARAVEAAPEPDPVEVLTRPGPTAAPPPGGGSGRDGAGADGEATGAEPLQRDRAASAATTTAGASATDTPAPGARQATPSPSQASPSQTSPSQTSPTKVSQPSSSGTKPSGGQAGGATATQAKTTSARSSAATASDAADPWAEPATPAAEPGRVAYLGDKAQFTFTGHAGTRANPASLPAGFYTVAVKFDGGDSITLQNVEVVSGRLTILDCKKAFMNCARRLGA